MRYCLRIEVIASSDLCLGALAASVPLTIVTIASLNCGLASGCMGFVSFGRGILLALRSSSVFIGTDIGDRVEVSTFELNDDSTSGTAAALC